MQETGAQAGKARLCRYVAAALCVVSAWVAVVLCRLAVGYCSVDWRCTDLTGWDLDSLQLAVGFAGSQGPYVRFTGRVDGGWSQNHPDGHWEGHWVEGDTHAIRVILRQGAYVPASGHCSVLYQPKENVTEERETVVGRIVGIGGSIALDPDSSRLTSRSIISLLVGVTSVLAFSAALRHWLRERRRSHEQARGPNTSVERPPSAS